MIYFTSDLHFGHINSIAMCNRPFTSVAEMDKTLIDNWNNKVLATDTIYVLGDICLTRKWEIVHNYLKQLHGKIHLIRGNHDNFLNDPKAIKHYFVAISDYIEVKYKEQLFIMSHYPMFDWNKKFRSSIMLYAHVHTKDPLFLTPYLGRCFDVGVDANGYAPVSADEIIEKMKSINNLGLINDDYQAAKINLWGQRGKEDKE